MNMTQYRDFVEFVSLPYSISGTVTPGETIRIKNWDGKGGTLLGKVGIATGQGQYDLRSRIIHPKVVR